MKNTKKYSKIINTDFNILNSIRKLYIKRLSKHDKCENLIINPLCFEFLIIECKRNFPIEHNELGKVYIFGVEIVKDYSCEFGSWYFK